MMNHHHRKLCFFLTIGILSSILPVLESTAQLETIEIQQDFSAYSGFKDTYVDQSNPEDNFESVFESRIYVDGDSGGFVYSLWKFSDLVGDLDYQIPPNARIINAKLSALVLTGAESNQSYVIAAFQREYDAHEVTYSSLWGENEPQPGIDYSEEISVSIDHAGNTSERTNWDITALVQSWVNGDPNYGLIIIPNPDVEEPIDFLQSNHNPTPKLIVKTSQNTFVFQYGLNGYTGLEDAETQNGLSDTFGNPNPQDTNYGFNPIISIYRNESGSTYNSALIKFNDVFGSGENQITPGTEILSAVLQIYVTGGTNTVKLREILHHKVDSIRYPVNTDWNEASVTSGNFFSDGFLPTEDLDVSTPVEEFKPENPGLQELDVTTSLQSWSNNPSANLGWMFDFQYEGGRRIPSVTFYAKDAWEQVGPPRLTVTYEATTAVTNYSIYSN